MMDAGRWRLALAAIIGAGLGGCGAEGGGEAQSDETVAEAEGGAELALGPADGRDLPPADLSRVAAGDPAPDFTALSSEGQPFTLSEFRGKKDVILFFYRGQW